jgi:hypothetical protein
MPRYAALIYIEEAEGEVDPEARAQTIAEYTEFEQNVAPVKAGGEALHPTSTATTIQIKGGRGGELVITDGPFAETKEVLGGLYLLDVADLDEAIKWAQQIPGAWYGKIEVRPVVEFEAPSDQA